MFERMTARATARAERERDAQAEALAERIGAASPGGIQSVRVADGVELSGPGLRRRFTLEPGLRWLLETLR